MIEEALQNHDLPFRWVGCDGAFGGDAEFRKGLPASVHFFADVHSTQRMFRQRPEWTLPERKGQGKPPILVPVNPVFPKGK